MNNHKIIFTGPVGSGKTTAIASISDVPPVTTEATATREMRADKDHTTVALDYGVLNLDDGNRVHIYGTPGQKRFDFMWDILKRGCIGAVLLIDNSRESALDDMRFFLDAFYDIVSERALVIGITRTDVCNRLNSRDYVEVLRKMNLMAPVFEVDARKRDDIATLVEALIYSLDTELSL